MVNLRVLSSVTLFIISNVKPVEPLMQESFYKLLGSLTSVKHVRIPELLNQLCNESQGSDTVLQDACYGCFFKATNQPLGYPSLASMSNCADLYLNNTDYGHCQRYLNNATSTPATKANPSTIYCTFLECIRQVNKDTLEALRVRPRMAASSGKTSRKAFFLYLKLYKQLARGVCIIKEQNSESNTVRPGAEPIDPRRQSIPPKRR
ncbi:uncharacterized protein LOC143368237 [Andrena cerasifolii]|uniref:uncharacterized protein LOC143368237 n=1 Tax=Andrena cerasifolii TaxID=2819439 RepID=UPI004037F94D